jgi:hypothetical protein
MLSAWLQIRLRGKYTKLMKITSLLCLPLLAFLVSIKLSFSLWQDGHQKGPLEVVSDSGGVVGGLAVVFSGIIIIMLLLIKEEGKR